MGRHLIFHTFSHDPYLNTNCGEFHHGEKVGSKFFIARCDAPELFDFVKEPFDPIALSVKGSAEAMVCFPVCLVRDVGRRTLRFDAIANPVGVISLVGQDDPFVRHRASGSRQSAVSRFPGPSASRGRDRALCNINVAVAPFLIAATGTKPSSTALPEPRVSGKQWVGRIDHVRDAINFPANITTIKSQAKQNRIVREGVSD